MAEALALANEGRALQLRVALRRQAIVLPADKRPRYDALVTELRGWERLAQSAKGADAIAALDEAAKLRKQIGELTAPYLSKETGLSRDLIPPGGALIAPVVTKFGGKLLVAAAGSDSPAVTAIDLPRFDSDRLHELMRGKDGKGGWLGAYQRQDLDAQQWLAAIQSLGPELWELLGAALDRGLKERGVKPGARVILMPTAALGFLPMGLAQEPRSGRRLVETYELVVAPSFEALASSASEVAKRPAPSLAAAINPTGEVPALALPFTEIEGALIAADFAGKPQLRLDASTATADLVLSALKGRSYWHFASHGEFNWDDAPIRPRHARARDAHHRPAAGKRGQPRPAAPRRALRLRDWALRYRAQPRRVRRPARHLHADRRGRRGGFAVAGRRPCHRAADGEALRPTPQCRPRATGGAARRTSVAATGNQGRAAVLCQERGGQGQARCRAAHRTDR